MHILYTGIGFQADGNGVDDDAQDNSTLQIPRNNCTNALPNNTE